MASNFRSSLHNQHRCYQCTLELPDSTPLWVLRQVEALASYKDFEKSPISSRSLRGSPVCEEVELISSEDTWGSSCNSAGSPPLAAYNETNLQLSINQLKGQEGT